LPYCSTGHQLRCQSIRVASPSVSTCLIFSTREGKRTAEEEAEEPNVKKARLDGDVDMMSATEPSTNKCTSLLFLCRFMIGTDCLQTLILAPLHQSRLPRQYRRPRNKVSSRREPGIMSSKRCHIHSCHQMTQLSRTASKSFPAFTCLLFECVLNRGDYCRRQFTLAPNFPSSNLLVRNPAGEPARSLYLTNDLVRAVLSANDYKRMRIMTAGTKIFMRQESGFGRREFDGEDSASAERVPRFRLLSEGLPVVLPYIKPDTIIDTDIPALRRLLETYYPLLNGFGEGFQRDVGSRCACALIFFQYIFPSSDYPVLR
jgi:hypothetical protein